MIGKTDFLRINAYAIKDLINQKLSQDSKFTDQIYEGSNLAILIDIFSYIAQNLIYMLNNAASESMFMDTQMYENINRLCNFIGYSPRGMSPSTVVVTLNSDDVKDYDKVILRKYSYVKANTAGGSGNSICYSVGNEDDEVRNIYGEDYRIRLYNGRWKLYPTVFTATGEPWETFTLENMKSSSEESSYVAHGFVDVYAVEYNMDGDDRPISIKSIRKYQYTDSQLFKIPIERQGTGERQQLLYSGNIVDYRGSISENYKSSSSKSMVFNLRLNENKQYEIKFGNGTNGATLPEGASIYVVYLDTDGPNGMVEPGDITGNVILNGIGAGTLLSEAIFNGSIDSTSYSVGEVNYYTGRVVNMGSSTHAVSEETVDEIRMNAPNWFRMGNRLVTKDDYEYYIKAHPILRAEISDVKCMNNWEYVSTFYKWLYNLGTKYFKDPRHYLNQNRLVKNDFQVADPADCNNIYLWIRTNGTNESKDTLFSGNSDKYATILKPMKDMTHEPIFRYAVEVAFVICSGPVGEVQAILQNGFSNFSNRSWLEVTIDDDAVYASPMIQHQIAGKIRKFFYERSLKIGGFVNFNGLIGEIMDIGGVVNIRTVYVPLNDDGTLNIQSPIVANGICFASWCEGLETLIDKGIDMEVSNTGRSLEQFQYPALLASIPIENHIKIIKRSMSSIQRVQY